MQPAKREGLAEAHGNTEPVRSRQLGSSDKTAAMQIGWSFCLRTFPGAAKRPCTVNSGRLVEGSTFPYLYIGSEFD